MSNVIKGEDKPGVTRLVTAIVIGAGQRGRNYSNFALDFPNRFKIVGVADPQSFRRKFLAKNHDIASKFVFKEWEEAFKVDRFADVAIIATPDPLHRAPAIEAANKGYHILLEKPMDVTEEGCRAITEACERNSVMLCVCHVLRYTPTVKTVKKLITEGAIGEVVSIQHQEPIGFYHFAHSFVRGNWRRQDQTSFSLLTKSCHDVDLIHFWMGDSKCVQVSSFGSLSHFTKASQPEGAASRCVDCQVEKTCPYSAIKIYLEPTKSGYLSSFVRVLCDEPDVESVTKALQTGPYGRCVYECDNDVASNQVVNMLFDKGQTASFSMVAFTEKLCVRKTQIFGTHGELSFEGGSAVRRFDFVTQTATLHPVSSPTVKTRLMGHGGADFYLMDSFVEAIAKNDPSLILSGPQETLTSHLLTFAAERSRVENRVLKL